MLGTYAYKDKGNISPKYVVVRIKGSIHCKLAYYANVMHVPYTYIKYQLIYLCGGFLSSK